jgi:hypothetical protein
MEHIDRRTKMEKLWFQRLQNFNLSPPPPNSIKVSVIFHSTYLSLIVALEDRQPARSKRNKSEEILAKMQIATYRHFNGLIVGRNLWRTC